ncbi:MAG TPA: endo alpha-1,4 polygalactosaminidase [bacterium]|nr:endo alpha-1,4 polygalactosaminidase [bacterium]
MRWWITGIVSGLILMLMGSVPASRGGQLSPADRLRAARTWVSYYSNGQIPQLLQFDMVDIDVEDGAANYEPQDVAMLKSQGKLVLSYINIGSAEPFRSYWSQVQPYILKKYPGWDEFYMDASKPGYREVLLTTVVPQILGKGVDGLFLDNVDAGSDTGRPDVTAGIVELVRQIHALHPTTLLIAQSSNLGVLTERGSDGRQFYQYVQGLAREEVSATYQGGYQKIPVRQSDAVLHALATWRSRGLTVFTLDYANSKELAQYAIARARAYGLIPYVGQRELNRVSSW